MSAKGTRAFRSFMHSKKKKNTGHPTHTSNILLDIGGGGEMDSRRLIVTGSGAAFYRFTLFSQVFAHDSYVERGLSKNVQAGVIGDDVPSPLQRTSLSLLFFEPLFSIGLYYYYYVSFLLAIGFGRAVLVENMG